MAASLTESRAMCEIAVRKIVITVIPHDRQRYETVGDWEVDTNGFNDRDEVRVSSMGNSDYELLVAVHELVEMHRCKRDGVRQALVDSFDMNYEKNRLPGDTAEPGDHPDAPYHAQHAAANRVEIALAQELGVDWTAYSTAVNSLGLRK